MRVISACLPASPQNAGGYSMPPAPSIHRFGTTTAPKILDLPDTVYINRPADDPETTVDDETAAA